MKEIFGLAKSMRRIITGDTAENIVLPVSLTAPVTLNTAFSAPPESEGKKFFLTVRGLSAKYSLRINGEEVFSGKSRFSGFLTDITAFALPGRELDITLEAEPLPGAYPSPAVTDAFITAVNASHFTLSPEGDSLLKIIPVFSASGITLSAEADVTEPNNYDVAVFSVLTQKGETVAKKTVKPTSPSVSFENIPLSPWDGGAGKDMYVLEACLMRDSEELDRISRSFGIKKAEFSKDGFYMLNGIKTPLDGVASSGFDRLEKDISVMESMCADTLYMTGLPLDDGAFSLFDRKGVSVIIDLPGEDLSYSPEDELPALCRRLSFHPSVAGFCISSRDPGFIKTACRAVKENTRGVFTMIKKPVLTENELCDAIPDALLLEINASCDGEKLTALANSFRTFCEQNPGAHFMVKLTGPDCIFDRSAGSCEKADCSQTYFSSRHERMWQIFGSAKGLAGFIAGDVADSEDAPGKRTGFVTFDREHLKDAALFYKSQFSAQPVVCLCNSGLGMVTDKYVDIRCYTNTPPVSLKVNGKTKKKYICRKESDCVFVFEGIKLRRKSNVLTVEAGGQTDSAAIFRSKSKLSKK